MRASNNRNVAGPQGPLAELATRIRAEHAAVVQAANDVAHHAIAAGRALIEAQGSVPKGQWADWVSRHCEISYRSARLYMQLTRAYDASGSSVASGNNVSDLAGLSLRGLMRQLTPQTHLTTSPSTKSTATKQTAAKPRRVTHCDLLELWAFMPAEERRAFFDGIGLHAIVQGIPDAWLGEAVMQLIEREHPDKPQPKKPSRKKVAIPDDLSIPQFLKVAAPANGEAANALTP